MKYTIENLHTAPGVASAFLKDFIRFGRGVFYRTYFLDADPHVLYVDRESPDGIPLDIEGFDFIHRTNSYGDGEIEAYQTEHYRRRAETLCSICGIYLTANTGMMRMVEEGPLYCSQCGEAVFNSIEF